MAVLYEKSGLYQCYGLDEVYRNRTKRAIKYNLWEMIDL